MRIFRLAAAAAVTAAFGLSASAQDKYEVKVATFVGPQHFMNKWLEQWGGKLEKASNGRLAFKFFHGAQMAPACPRAGTTTRRPGRSSRGRSAPAPAPSARRGRT